MTTNHRKLKWCLTPITLFAISWHLISTSQAQTPPEESIDLVHYSYATLLGTGFYKVGDRRVGVLRVPLSYQVRETESSNKPGIRITIPVTVGVHNFELSDIPELRLDDLVTMTVMPGVEFNFQINDRWAVDPSVNIGYGRDLTNGDSSLLWGAGVRSRYAFETTKPALTLGSEALYSGYNPDKGSADSIVRLALGLDARIPTGWSIGNSNLFVGTHAIAYYYPVSLTFRSIDFDRFKTRTEFEFGLALGRYPSFEILGFEFDRVGLAYRYSDEISAIIMTTSFPF